MDYMLQILKTWRTRKKLSFIQIFGLSVCIGAALLILLYVRFELSFDTFHFGRDIYRVESRLYEGGTLTDNWATTTFGHGPAISREIPGVEAFVRVTAQDRAQEVSYEDRQFTEASYCYTEPSFFTFFRFPILKGEKKGQLTRPHTLVLTHSAAHRYFGDTDPIGKILTFRSSSAEQHFEVTGVIDDMPDNSHLRFDFLLSYASIPEARRDIWYIHGVYTYVKLKEGIAPGHIETAFRPLSGKYKTAALKHKDWAIELIPLEEIHLTPRKSYEKETKGSRTAVYILSFMGLALLGIGWVNALNLTIARYLQRSREWGVRKAFGASRRQLILQGLLEAGLLNLLAMILALGWLEAALPMVYRWAGQDFGAGAFAQPFFWAIAALVWLAGTLFTGLYPSFLLTRIRPSDIMRGKFLHSKKGNGIRKTLMVVQFIVSFVLVSGTIVVLSQVRYMQQTTSALPLRQVLVLNYPSFTGDMVAKTESFKRQLKQKAYIRNVTVSGAVPGAEVANYFTNRPYGSDLSQVKLIQMFAVDYDYLAVYPPVMAAGRIFSEHYGNEQNKVVLNEEAARLLGFPSAEAALGKQLAMEVLVEPLEIIGVTKNYHQQSLAEPYKPILFFIHTEVPFIPTPYISIRLDGGIAGAKHLEEIEQLYRQFFPTALFSYFYLDDFNRHQYKADRNFGWMFACTALLAIFVACLGLWVMTLFSTRSRVKEVGIRKVLGAGKATLWAVLTSELAFLTGVATLLGVPISAFLMNEWLETYAFHIALPIWAYPAACLALMLVALLTVAHQVWRVIRLKPMRVLKSE